MSEKTVAQEPIEVRRKRLIHRSRYTGMKETDMLLGAFAERYVPGFDTADLDLYEQLLDAPDPAIFDWATGREEAPAEYQNRIMILLKTFKNVV
jgi:antitoxin CptB